MKKYLVTIDSGISSTGITIYNRKTDFYTLIAFCDVTSKYQWADTKLAKANKTKKDEINLIDKNYQMFVVPHDHKKFNAMDSFERLISIAKSVIGLLKKNIDADDFDLYFEEVAFGRGQSNTISQYATLWKYFIFRSFNKTIGKPLYNSKVKKTIIGKGNATKDEVIDFLSNEYDIHSEMQKYLSDINIRVNDGGFFEDITDSFMMSKYVQKLGE